MNITQESVNGFVVGHGGADVVSKPIVAAEYARKAYKGVRVRAATANTIVIYVGPEGVSESNGYPLPAGEEMTLPIEDPSKVHVMATPVGNAQQVVTLTDAVLGNTFTLIFDGATTAAIAVDAVAADVEDALEALATIGVGNVDVAGDAGGPYIVEFTGILAKQDVSLMAGDVGRKSEKQTISLDATVSDGTFTLTFDAHETAAIAYDAPAADVQAALEALDSIGHGQVAVTGSAGGPWQAEFTGTLADTDVAAMTGDGTNLVGDVTDVTIEETVKGCGTSITITKTDASAGSLYSWLSV